jgi:hypothetical protein
VVLGELDAVGAGHVDRLLREADAFDGCAGHIVHIVGPGDDPPSQPIDVL